MSKTIPAGTEVLIFYYNVGLGPNQDDCNFIKGLVESCETVEISTMHGSPWNEVLYKVLGEDNNTYYGNYDTHITGNYYFRTVDDHVKHLQNKIRNNCNQINDLNVENSKLFDLIADLCIENIEESNLSTNDHIDSNIFEREFKSLDEKVSVLVKENVKRCRRNNIILNKTK